VAHGGKHVDTAQAAAIVGDRYDDFADAPAHALLTAATGCDLLVVGSRGLHGIRALGSVSERVAHEAPCSVLVVRNAGV
jgi:nucleotide-binding universal stress UspA family protein